MFDVFPLTQNEALPVIFHATINLVIMITYYFIISEKQTFNLNFNTKLLFF